MKKVAALVYGLFAYLGFVAILLYIIGFLGRFGVPKDVDSGPETPFAVALAINVGLLVLFGLQHSIMARPGFKTWWTVPQPLERTTYVFISDLLMVLLFWQWRPMPGVILDVQNSIGSGVL